MAITTFLQGFVVRGASLRRRLDRGQTLDEFGVGGVGGTFRSIALTAAALIIIGAAVLYNFGFQTFPPAVNGFGPPSFTASRPTTTQASDSGATASSPTEPTGW